MPPNVLSKQTIHTGINNKYYEVKQQLFFQYIHFPACIVFKPCNGCQYALDSAWNVIYPLNIKERNHFIETSISLLCFDCRSIFVNKITKAEKKKDWLEFSTKHQDRDQHHLSLELKWNQLSKKEISKEKWNEICRKSKW